MVLHAGIVCYKKNGSMMTFNSVTRQKEYYNLIAVGPHDINGVDLMFDNLRTKLTGEFGCACICLGYTYDSEIRKKFIEAAKSFGFANVHITDWCSMNYYDLVPQLSSYRIMVDDVIWLFCGKHCYVWEKGSEFAEFLGEFEYSDTVGSLKWIRRKCGSDPDFIFYGDIYQTKSKTVEKIFRNAVVFPYTSFNSVEGLLIGAMLMTHYTHLYQYKTEPMLERDIKLKINNRIILSVDKWSPLPCAFERFIIKPHGCNTLEIMSHFNKTHQKLPDFDKFNLILYIDENGICSIAYDEVDLNEQTNVTDFNSESNNVEIENISLGIMPAQNEIVYGSEIVENRMCIKIDNMAEESYKIEKIDNILAETKEKMNLKENQRLKNLYIFLDSSYNNEIRKAFIDAAAKCGFENVEIVGQESVNFFCGINECKNIEDLDECFLWTLNELGCLVWKKTALYANFMCIIPGIYSTEKGALKMKEFSTEMNIDPKLIFYFKNDEIKTSTENVKWKSFVFNMSQCKLDIDGVLDREIVTKFGDHEICIVPAYQKLPLSIMKELTNDTDSDELLITECSNIIINIPRYASYYLQIDIDKNGIYSINIIDNRVDDDEKNETEKKKQLPKFALSDNDDPTSAEADEIFDSYEEPQIPESKEKLKAFRGPMIMPELFAPQETPNPLEQLITASANSIPRKLQHHQTDELLSPPVNALMPPPSYEESQSYFRQPSPVPFLHRSTTSLHQEEDKDDDGNDAETILQIRAKLAEQKRALIDRLEPKILRFAAFEDVKKVGDMMVHKDISELLEFLENEELLKAKVSDALNFLHGTTNATSSPRNQIRSRQKTSSSRTTTSNNPQSRPRWR